MQESESDFLYHSRAVPTFELFYSLDDNDLSGTQKLGMQDLRQLREK